MLQRGTIVLDSATRMKRCGDDAFEIILQSRVYQLFATKEKDDCLKTDIWMGKINEVINNL